MDKYDGTTSILSISSKRSFLKDCKQVVKHMEDLGIASSIIPHRSIVCNRTNPCSCVVELGCDIRLAGLKASLIKPLVWNSLQKKFNLGCAHLCIPGQYHGCINDFDKLSKHKNA